ncbi:hypothetical protein FO470_02955 [Starkeya sp. 3C]|uniref:Uncharacterized protein n=1 Tax=Ancylobacter moscoviensis TaxID=2597768 RepID=A0ABY3DV01_9HYPH|nr:hypothetical protein [Ancylobacter moscoviensis]TSJ64261.1 hypothetical protein FO470_02955 [Ancylobacter moscoviensis]
MLLIVSVAVATAAAGPVFGLSAGFAPFGADGFPAFAGAGAEGVAVAVFDGTADFLTTPALATPALATPALVTGALATGSLAAGPSAPVFARDPGLARGAERDLEVGAAAMGVRPVSGGR